MSFATYLFPLNISLNRTVGIIATNLNLLLGLSFYFGINTFKRIFLFFDETKNNNKTNENRRMKFTIEFQFHWHHWIHHFPFTVSLLIGFHFYVLKSTLKSIGFVDNLSMNYLEFILISHGPVDIAYSIAFVYGIQRYVVDCCITSLNSINEINGRQINSQKSWEPSKTKSNRQ